MNLGFTWFDLLALGVLALSGVMAFARGLIREVFSIIAFIGAAVAAVFFADMLRPLVEQLTPVRGPIASVAAGLLIFLVVFIAITVVTSAVAKTAHQSAEIGGFDRAAGLAFGVLRGVLVVSLFVLLMRQTTDDAHTSPQASMPEAIVAARTYPIYEGVAKALEQILPQARQRAHAIIEQRRQNESASTTTATTTTAPAQSGGATTH
ncbi:MAG TPA: CvpA family protein [Caulobacterales bacterium]|nr:CvpA family protein [Caulobacterales bacterium]